MPCRRRVLDENADGCVWHGSQAPPRVASGPAAPKGPRAVRRDKLASIVGRPLTDDERRHPWMIMTDAVQLLDQALTSGQLKGTALIEHAEKLIRSCKIILDAGVAEKMALAQTQATESQGRMLISALTESIDHVFSQLDLDPLDYSRARSCLVASVGASMTGSPMPALAPRAQVQAYLPRVPALVRPAYTEAASLDPDIDRSPLEDHARAWHKDSRVHNIEDNAIEADVIEVEVVKDGPTQNEMNDHHNDDHSSFDVHEWARLNGVTLPPARPHLERARDTEQ